MRKAAAAGGEKINDCAKEMFEHEAFYRLPGHCYLSCERLSLSQQ